MKRRKYIFIPITVLIILYVTTFYSPQLTLRRILFFHYPVQSLTCSIEKTDFVDGIYGQQYIIHGVAGKFGMDIRYAYLKKNSYGWYYWTGGGTGP